MTGLLHPAMAFGMALLGSLAAMPTAVAAGSRLGVMVRPRLFGRGDRWVCPLGGAALAMVASVVVLATGDGSRPIWALLAGGLALLALGLFDDRGRKGLSPGARLSIEGLVATAAWWAGLRPDFSAVPGMDLALTVFFLVAASNAFNLLDNMDGVAGATAVVSAAGILVLAALFGDPILAGLAAAVGGASLGFLHHNLAGRTVFLGNGGALFLGFVLGGAALMLPLPLSGPWSLAAAVTIMAVPAADTTLVILARTFAGRPVAEGGTDHASHRLVALGFTPLRSALAHATGAAVAAGSVGMAAGTGRPEVLIGALASFGVVGLGLLKVPVYEVDPAGTIEPTRSLVPALPSGVTTPRS